MSYLFHRSSVWIYLQFFEALTEDISDLQTGFIFTIDLKSISFESK